MSRLDMRGSPSMSDAEPLDAEGIAATARPPTPSPSLAAHSVDVGVQPDPVTLSDPSFDDEGRLCWTAPSRAGAAADPRPT